MTQTNHGVLGEGLKLYTDGYAPDGKAAPHRGPPEHDWWERGVVSALSDSQRRNINREIEKNPDVTREELIDANLLVPVVTKRFDARFSPIPSETIGRRSRG